MAQYSKQTVRLQFPKDIHFGDDVTIWISRVGDIASQMYLKVDWPSDAPTTVSPSQGTAMIQRVELLYKDQLIERVYGENLYMLGDLTVSQGKQAVLSNLVGKNTTSNLSSYYIELPFTVNLPLVALEEAPRLRVVFNPVLGYTKTISVNLFVDYVYVTQAEREWFQKNDLHYATSNWQRLDFQIPVTPVQTTYTFFTEFVGDVKELFWIIQSAAASNVYDYGSTDFLVNLRLSLNGQERITSDIGTPMYLRPLQGIQYHTRIPDGKYYMYSFALAPEENQPTGEIHMQGITRQQHDLTLTTHASTRTLRIYAWTYNVLQIKDKNVRMLYNLREAGTTQLQIKSGESGTVSNVFDYIITSRAGVAAPSLGSGTTGGGGGGGGGSSVTATGGTVTTYSLSGTTYKVHTFTSSGTFTVSGGSFSCDILVVAGGGGGGAGYSSMVDVPAGGGGAGGLITTTGVTFASSSYSITVGAGGAGQVGALFTSPGENGGDSSIIGGAVSYTAYGGGGGASGDSGPGQNGGSGGGGAQVYNGGTGISGQGREGGNPSAIVAFSAGGGGGKMEPGSNGDEFSSGVGGDGYASSITGTVVYYAGGGGGGAGASPGPDIFPGSGGLGGGGNGGGLGKNALNGVANTGGGGGGGGGSRFSVGQDAGNGGSGIVIIRYIDGSGIPSGGGGGGVVTLFSQLSPSAVSSCMGAFSLNSVNSATATVIRVRRSSDNATRDVTADTTGNLTVGGTSLSAWLGGATGYVTTWYDQSGNGSHMSCSSTSIQPIIDTTNKWIDFKTSAYFDTSATPSSGPVPWDKTKNFTVVCRHSTIGNGTGGICGVSNSAPNYNSANYTNNFRRESSQYQNYWFYNDINGGTYGAGNSVTFKWNGTNRYIYSNGTLVTSAASSNWLQTSSYAQMIGKTTCDATMNGEMYTLFTFNSALSDADRNLLEGSQIIGIVTTLAGTAGASGSTDGTGSAARFTQPYSLAYVGPDSLYVCDTNNHTIRKIVISTGVVTTFVGTAGTPGFTDGTGSAARFRSPIDIVYDGSGNLYVTDTGNYSLRKIDISTAAVTTLAAGQFDFAAFITYDGSGNLYVTDIFGHTVRKIVISTGAVTTLAGTRGASGSTDGTGAAARFNTPTGITYDGSGNLYVADAQNFTIRKIVISTAAVTTFAGTAGAFGSTDGTGSAARFNFPSDIVYDGSGNLYVLDTSNYTIRKIFISTADVTTLAGTAGASGSTDATGSAARFNTMYGITYDGSGKLYVADSQNCTIRTIT